MSVPLGHSISGPDHAPVLILANSVGTTMSMWDAQVGSVLADHLRLLRFDHRGHGSSPVPAGPYTIADLGGDVVALMDSLGVASAAYCGTSLGGMVGIWLGAHAPERFSSLGLCSVAARMSNPGAYLERAERVRAEGMAAIADAVVSRWFTPTFRERDAATVAGFVEDLRRVPAEGYAGCCEALAEMDLGPDLAQISAPTLVIMGADDQATLPEQGGAVAAGISDAHCEIVAGAAHLVGVEQPDAVLRLLMNHFVAEGVR